VRAPAAPLGRGAILTLAALAACTPAEAPRRASLRAPTPRAPRSYAFVLVDLGGGVDLSPERARGRLLTDPDSLRSHVRASSFGADDVTGEVFGPLRWSFASGCDFAGLANGLRAQVPGSFDHYLWYFGTRQDVCGWKGIATVGTAQGPTRDTWLDATSSCLVLAQEPAHNFGLQHASALACPHAPLLDDPNGCAGSEYGDVFDPMGVGCRHPNAWEKEYRGWLSGCNGVDVGASGTFTLLPLESRCDGVQLLRIAAGAPRAFKRGAFGGLPAGTDPLTHYTVELRTPRDFDGTLGGEAALAPQVLIHVGAPRTPPTQAATHTYLLDMNADTPTLADAALPVGQTFIDPNGTVRITARAVSAARATIDVQLLRATAPSTCLDGRPFEAPGPGPESCEPDATPMSVDASVDVDAEAPIQRMADASDEAPTAPEPPTTDARAASDVAARAVGAQGVPRVGCGCAAGGAARPTALAPWGLAALALAVTSRRRSSSSSRRPRPPRSPS
jgi:MYXO-CTERM domain-containing protein